MTTSTMFASRAVNRPVEPGSIALCAHCGLQVKFRAKVRQHQVIANVYEKGAWVRVEHYHAECYDEAAHPYGEVPD